MFLWSMRRKMKTQRRAMTLVELLLASAVTGMTAAAGATMVYAVANAASDTRDYRTDRAQGRRALYRIGSLIRSARAIGEVTATSVTLWEQDTNKNDVIDLFETSIIRYDATYQVIIYEHLVPTTSVMPSGALATSTLINTTALGSAIQRDEKETLVLSQDVASCSFTGYPSNTDTRVVQTKFTIPREDQTLSFSTAAAPRPVADYLLISSTLLPKAAATADTSSGQMRRKVISPWDGLTTQLSAP